MATTWKEEKISLQGVELEYRAGGSGPPLLLLQDIDDCFEFLPYHDLLGEKFRVLLPALPGFGNTQRPAWLDSVDDLSYFLLDFVDRLRAGPVTLLGAGFGGWLCAEMAVRCQHHLQSLILADAFGIKISGPTVRDIADIFVLSHDELAKIAWHDPARAQEMKVPGNPGITHEDLVESLRRRETAQTIGWRPFMHNPRLKRRLARISIPTLVVWGESDRVVTPQYGRAYHEAIPGSIFKSIPQAGHYPYRERPEEFVNVVIDALRSFG